MSVDPIWEWVEAELLACYGEGENTDWPWFNDLVGVVVDLIERRLGDKEALQGELDAARTHLGEIASQLRREQDAAHATRIEYDKRNRTLDRVIAERNEARAERDSAQAELARAIRYRDSHITADYHGGKP